MPPRCSRAPETFSAPAAECHWHPCAFSSSKLCLPRRRLALLGHWHPAHCGGSSKMSSCDVAQNARGQISPSESPGRRPEIVSLWGHPSHASAVTRITAMTRIEVYICRMPLKIDSNPKRARGPKVHGHTSRAQPTHVTAGLSRQCEPGRPGLGLVAETKTFDMDFRSALGITGPKLGLV